MLYDYKQELYAPGFDRLIARLEADFAPALEAIGEVLRRSSKFTEVEVSSLRHSAQSYSLGISGRQRLGKTKGDHLNFVLLVGELSEEYTSRLILGWGEGSQPTVHRDHTLEVPVFTRRIRNSSDVAGLERHWALMFSVFFKVALRGRPSPAWMRYLRTILANRRLKEPRK